MRRCIPYLIQHDPHGAYEVIDNLTGLPVARFPYKRELDRGHAYTLACAETKDRNSRAPLPQLEHPNDHR